nr:hypothetical protein [Tanacetum cinerariifolium]
MIFKCMYLITRLGSSTSTIIGVELQARFININDYSSRELVVLIEVDCAIIKTLSLLAFTMPEKEEYRCEEAKRHMEGVTHRLRSELEKQKYSNNTLTTHSSAIHVTRLELSVFDRTVAVIVVMFDESATELVKVPADSIFKVEDEKSHTYYEYGSFESSTCWKINHTEPVKESACSSTDDAIADKHIPSLKRLSRHPSVATPSKPHDAKKTKRIDLEDSEIEATFGSSREAN